MKSGAFLGRGRFGLAKLASSAAGVQELILPYGESPCNRVACWEKFESACLPSDWPFSPGGFVAPGGLSA